MACLTPYIGISQENFIVRAACNGFGILDYGLYHCHLQAQIWSYFSGLRHTSHKVNVWKVFNCKHNQHLSPSWPKFLQDFVFQQISPKIQYKSLWCVWARPPPSYLAVQWVDFLSAGQLAQCWSHRAPGNCSESVQTRDHMQYFMTGDLFGFCINFWR